MELRIDMPIQKDAVNNLKSIPGTYLSLQDVDVMALLRWGSGNTGG